VRDITTVITYCDVERDYNCNCDYDSVLKEGRRQTFPLIMSLAQKPPNISN
jgi:hypothetical protein